MIVSRDFVDTIRQSGMSPPDIITPGKIHRFPGIGKTNGNQAGWAKVFDDLSGGMFGDWSSDYKETWQMERDAITGRPYPYLYSGSKRKSAAPEADPSDYAHQLWEAASEEWEGHPYAASKGITWQAGARRGVVSGRVVGRNADCLLIPAYQLDNKQLFGVQAINANGEKQSFGPIKRHGLLLGNDRDTSRVWYVCEGWASAVSLVFHHTNGQGCCAVAFGKSNLVSLAQEINRIYSPKAVCFISERDD